MPWTLGCKTVLTQEGVAVRFLIIALTVMLLAAASRAENLTVVQSEFKPLIEMRNERIQSCSVHFTVVLQRQDSTLMGAQGTVNHVHFEGMIPAMLLKLIVVAFDDGEVMRRVPVRNFNIRADNVDTRGLRRQPGDDAGSFMLSISTFDNPDMALSVDIGFNEGLWYFVSGEELDDNWTFRLPPLDAASPTFQEYLACSQDLLSEAIEDVQSLMLESN